MPQAGVTCPQSLAASLLPSGFFWPRALGVVSREGDAGGPSLFLDFVAAAPPVCSHGEGSAPAAASTSAHGLSTPQWLLLDAPRNTGRPCHPRPRPQGPRGAWPPCVLTLSPCTGLPAPAGGPPAVLRVLRCGSERGGPADGQRHRDCRQGGVGGHGDPAAAGHGAGSVGRWQHPAGLVLCRWPHAAHQ